MLFRRIVVVLGGGLVLAACATSSPPPAEPRPAPLPSGPSTTGSERHRIYGRADLEVLARHEEWAELVEHLEDVAPSARDDVWNDLAARAVAGFLRKPPASARAIDVAARAESLVRRHPFLRSSRELRAAWGDVVVAAAGAVSICWTRRTDEDPCARLVASMRAIDDPAKAMDAARAAHGVGQAALAMAFYRIAAEGDPDATCSDEHALAEMLDGLRRTEATPHRVDAELVRDLCRAHKHAGGGRRGHFVTPDGLFGLVLDREQPVPRARIDGGADVLELAVMRNDDGVVLVSARGDLEVFVSKDVGRVFIVSTPSRGRSDPPIKLRRDGSGQALAEPAATTADAAVVKALEANVRARCGREIKLELPAKVESTAVARGLYHAAHRAAAALASVCRDDAGKEAVRREVSAVRLVVRDGAEPTLDLRSSGVLVVEARYDDEAFGPSAETIRTFVERRL